MSLCHQCCKGGLCGSYVDWDIHFWSEKQLICNSKLTYFSYQTSIFTNLKQLNSLATARTFSMKLAVRHAWRSLCRAIFMTSWKYRQISCRLYSIKVNSRESHISPHQYSIQLKQNWEGVVDWEMGLKRLKMTDVLICWGGIIIILKNWAENWSLEPKLDRKWP